MLIIIFEYFNGWEHKEAVAAGEGWSMVGAGWSVARSGWWSAASARAGGSAARAEEDEEAEEEAEAEAEAEGVDEAEAKAAERGWGEEEGSGGEEEVVWGEKHWGAGKIRGFACKVGDSDGAITRSEAFSRRTSRESELDEKEGVDASQNGDQQTNRWDLCAGESSYVRHMVCKELIRKGTVWRASRGGQRSLPLIRLLQLHGLTHGWNGCATEGHQRVGPRKRSHVQETHLHQRLRLRQVAIRLLKNWLRTERRTLPRLLCSRPSHRSTAWDKVLRATTVKLLYQC